MSALRRLSRSAAAGADVPKEQDRRGESEPEMKVAGGVPPIFVAEVIKQIPGKRQEGDHGQEEGTVAAIFAGMPGAADVAGKQGAQQEDENHGAETVNFHEPGFELPQ